MGALMGRGTGCGSRAAGAAIAIATNNGDIGGGEVMLLAIADALAQMGIDPLVIGPSGPGDLVEESVLRGFDTIALRADSRPAYIAALARWRLSHLDLPLWCNGLVPTFATAGMGPRIGHLHILPTGPNARAARLGRIGADTLLVPSRAMAQQIPGTRVFANWTAPLDRLPPRAGDSEAPRIGFLGRLTRGKGVDVLARAMRTVIEARLGARLVLAGENRFGSPEDDAAIRAALAPIEANVERLGWVGREEFFSSIDLAVFPSVWPESFGLVVAEAMALGVPFVVSDAGALVEVAGIEHPWVARAGDAASLARTIRFALSASPEKLDRVLSAARLRWEQQFSPEAGTRRVAQLLSDLSPHSWTEETR